MAVKKCNFKIGEGIVIRENIMNSKRLIFISLGLLAIIGIGFAIYKIVQIKKDDFVVSVQVDFESQEGFNYFDILGKVSENGEEQQVTQSNVTLENGAAIFGQFPVRGANLKPRVNYDTALYIRWKINAENTCERFSLMPFINQERPTTNAYGIGVGGCSFQALQAELVSDNPAAYDAPSQSQGTIILENDQWLNAVIWIEKGTPTPTMKIFAWQAENPNIYYIEKRLLTGLEESNMFLFSFDVVSGSIAVVSFQMISGNIESYLWFNAPAFSKNYENMVTLFNTDFNDQ